jgi:hypothetical protein
MMSQARPNATVNKQGETKKIDPELLEEVENSSQLLNSSSLFQEYACAPNALNRIKRGTVIPRQTPTIKGLLPPICLPFHQTLLHQQRNFFPQPPTLTLLL